MLTTVVNAMARRYGRRCVRGAAVEYVFNGFFLFFLVLSNRRRDHPFRDTTFEYERADKYTLRVEIYFYL